MKKELFADEDLRLWWLMRLASDAVDKAEQKELHQYGITPRESAVLLVVQAIGRKATPAEISRWLLREPHSVSGILNRMEKDGLLKKDKNLDRKNLIRVTLTRKGRQVYRQSTKREAVHRIISALSQKERQQLYSVTEVVWNRASKEIGAASKLPF